jgi:hypothetical protein
MNERIKEFIEQATTEEHDGFRYFDKKKFAELIVKKCMSISSEAMTNDNWPPHMIAKHFGVKE